MKTTGLFLFALTALGFFYAGCSKDYEYPGSSATGGAGAVNTNTMEYTVDRIDTRSNSVSADQRDSFLLISGGTTNTNYPLLQLKIARPLAYINVIYLTPDNAAKYEVIYIPSTEKTANYSTRNFKSNSGTSGTISLTSADSLRGMATGSFQVTVSNTIGVTKAINGNFSATYIK